MRKIFAFLTAAALALVVAQPLGAAKLYNLVRVATATTGTGTVTLGAASTGYLTFGEAGVQNADVVSYVIRDGNDVEMGTGTYTSAGTTLARDTVTISKIGGTAGTSKISLSGNAIVTIAARAEDFPPTDAVYVTGAAHAGLSAERVTTDTATVTWDQATAGQIKANVPAASTTVAGVSEFATAGEFRTGTDTGRSLVVDQTWSAADWVGLTDGATITPDFSTGFNLSVTLGGNRTLANPTNTKAGQTGCIEITQDGTGSRTLAYGTNWKFPGGTDPVLTTAANAVDLLCYVVKSSTVIHAAINKDMK